MGQSRIEFIQGVAKANWNIAVYEDDLETSFLDMDIQFSSVPPDIGDVAEDIV